MKWCKGIGTEVDTKSGGEWFGMVWNGWEWGWEWWKKVAEIDTKNGRKWWGMGESGLLNFWETGNWDRAVRKPPSPHTPIPAPLSTTSPHQSTTLTPASLPTSFTVTFSFPYHNMEKHSVFHSLTDFNRAFHRQISHLPNFTSIITADLFSISWYGKVMPPSQQYPLNFPYPTPNYM